jgi:predicted nucleic-acid-binding Zn-ribbon protein
MPLTREQAYKLQQWLNSRGVNLDCPMCGSAQWETGEIVSGTSIDDTRNALPMVQVVCVNCGYVMLFAALPIGLGV